MSEGRIIIWDAFCCANCRNCVSGMVGNLLCLLQRLNDASLLEVKATNVCGWYQRKEEA